MTESGVEEEIYKKLDTIEKEIANLKHAFLQNMQYMQPKQVVSLKGLLKGADVSEEDIQKAKKIAIQARRGINAVCDRHSSLYLAYNKRQ